MAIRFKRGGMSDLLPGETLLVSQKAFRAITSLAPPNYRIGFSCPLWTFNLCVTDQRVLLATEMFAKRCTQEIDMWFPSTIPPDQTEVLTGVAIKNGLFGRCLETRSRDPKRWKWMCFPNMTLRFFFHDPEEFEQVIREQMNQNGTANRVGGRS
jgi:hypothetical protein